MNVTTGTIARTIILALALINQLLASFGCEVINIPNETIDAFVDSAFLIISAIVGFWKNNSFTKNAIKADEYLKELKTIKE